MEVKVFPTVLIAFAIVKKGNRYLCTHERDGWYLPAGRVDFGETLTTGAIREALEETRVPVKLEGILRLEHTPGLKNSRVRALFLASPIGDTPPRSKDEADREIIEAKWLTIDEVKSIPPKEARSSEFYEILTWVDSGAPIYPLNIFTGQDDVEIDHCVVITNLLYEVSMIVQREDLFCVMKMPNGEWSIPKVYQDKPKTFKVSATSILFNALGVVPQLKGIRQIVHHANTSFAVSYVAEIPADVPMEKLNAKPNEFKWIKLEEAESAGLSKESIALLEDVYHKRVPLAFVDMITSEGAPMVV